MDKTKKHIPLSGLRDDVTSKCLTQQEVLNNAKYTQDGYVKMYGSIVEGIEES